MFVSDVRLLVSRPAADGVGGPGAEQNHLSVPVSGPGAWATAMNNLGIMPVGISGQQLVSGTLLNQSLTVERKLRRPRGLKFT